MVYVEIAKEKLQGLTQDRRLSRGERAFLLSLLPLIENGQIYNASENRPMSVREIAKATGIARKAAGQYLQSLCETGVLQLSLYRNQRHYSLTADYRCDAS